MVAGTRKGMLEMIRINAFYVLKQKFQTVTRRLSENSARSEDCEKLRIKISASEENSGAI